MLDCVRRIMLRVWGCEERVAAGLKGSPGRNCCSLDVCDFEYVTGLAYIHCAE